jgi:hypothetical protein
MIASCTTIATATAAVERLAPRNVSRIAAALITRAIGSQEGCHEE